MKLLKKIMSDFRKNCTGSMTVEISMIAPIIILIVVVLMNMSMLCYDKVVVENCMTEHYNESYYTNKSFKNNVNNNMLILQVKKTNLKNNSDGYDVNVLLDMRKVFKGLNSLIVKNKSNIVVSDKNSKENCMDYLLEKRNKK